MEPHTIGIDLGKTIFHLVGLNLRGESNSLNGLRPVVSLDLSLGYDRVRSCTDFEKPQGRAAALAAARLRRAQRLGSVNRNAFSRDVAGYLEEEVAGRVIEIQGEGTAVRIAAVTHSERFTEVDGSHEVSVRVVVLHAVSELESPVWSVLPHSQADGPPSRINIRVVNLGPPSIPELVRFLDGLIADRELDVPKANHGFADVVSGRRRVRLDRAGLTMDGSSPRCHCG
jgi:hypothetical protein